MAQYALGVSYQSARHIRFLNTTLFRRVVDYCNLILTCE